MSSRWVPLAMVREGVTPLLVDVLFDLEREPLERRLPPALMSHVPLEKAYTLARERGFAAIRRSDPLAASLHDPHVLTDSGRVLLASYRKACQVLGGRS